MVKLKMTAAEFRYVRNNYQGYCTECNTFTTDSVEPDAERYRCDQCDRESVMGADYALVCDHVQIVEGDEHEGL